MTVYYYKPQTFLSENENEVFFENVKTIFGEDIKIEEYKLGTPIKDGILWILMHGEYINNNKKQVKVITSINDPYSDYTAKTIELDNEFLFKHEVEKDNQDSYYYIWTKYFQVFFPTYNCLIICDSCHSNTINLCNIMDGHKNRFLTAGYDQEYLTQMGTHLELFLINYFKNNNKNLLYESDEIIYKTLYEKYLNDDILYSYLRGSEKNNDSKNYEEEEEEIVENIN